MPTDYHLVEARIQSAIETLKAQEKPNVSKIARDFNVPRTRLEARYKGRQSKSDRPAANLKLSAAQDSALCQHLDILDQLGTPPRPSTIEKRANALLKEAHTDPTTPAPVVSANWTHRWLARHPKYKFRHRKAKEASREKASRQENLEQRSSSSSSSSSEREDDAPGGNLPTTIEDFERLRRKLSRPIADEAKFQHYLDLLARGAIAKCHLVQSLRKELAELAASNARMARNKTAPPRQPPQPLGTESTDFVAQVARLEEESDISRARNQLRKKWRPVMSELVERALDNGLITRRPEASRKK